MNLTLKNPKITGYICAVLAVSLMAGLGVFIKQINAPDSLIAIARFYIGFFFFLIYLIGKNQLKLIQPLQKSYFPLLLSGISWSLLMISYTKAIRVTSLTYAAFLLYLAPIIATILAFFWLKEKLHLQQILALTFAFLGFILILDFNPSEGLQNLSKSGWGLLSALSYATFVVFNRKIPESCHSQTRIFYQFLTASLILLPFWLQFDLKFITLNNSLWLIGVGFFHGFLAITLTITAVKHLKASEYGIISYIEPLLATCIGFLFYSETLTLLQGLGGFLILCCGMSQIGLTQK